jgi:ATP-dependent Zn protease
MLNELFVIASYAVPIYIFISIISLFINFSSPKKPFNNNMKIKNNQSNNNPFGFMNNFQKEEEESLFTKQNVTLESWAGSPEVIDECKEVISYIENKEKYKQIGAEMPKGILLEGPPGTGKTLLAKAISSETKSTFIPMAGSEFVELFVGMGASRVRTLLGINTAILFTISGLGIYLGVIKKYMDKLDTLIQRCSEEDQIPFTET